MKIAPEHKQFIHTFQCSRSSREPNGLCATSCLSLQGGTSAHDWRR